MEGMVSDHIRSRFKDGPSFGYLLEMGKQPQTFYVFQVAKLTSSGSTAGSARRSPAAPPTDPDVRH